MKNRSLTLSDLRNQPLDILVVGGGIVGAGVVRDAALRGLRVGLIDQNDFASGTSSRSSRLLHGGIRYLAQGRVGLVREASMEKAVLNRIAPHLAEPLSFVFPTFRNSGWPLWQLRVGVAIYDLLCGGKNLGKSRGIPKKETLRVLPGLRADGLVGAVRYFDGFTNDARLVLDTLRSAAKTGALVANYVKLEECARDGDTWLCRVCDALSGEEFSVRSRTIVNATGPWANQLQHSAVTLRLTKGIHLVLDRKKLPFEDAVVITEGSRILFLIPWKERVIVGTTDTDYAEAPEEVRSTVEDVQYLLSTVNRFFPTVKLAFTDVISSWAGLRPLLADPKGNPSDISRAHEITNPQPGWWDVAGGKLTTYRLMAEQTVDRLLKELGRSFVGSVTAKQPLLSDDDGIGCSGIAPPQFCRDTVTRLLQKEWAVHLDDVMIRRTSWQHYHRDAESKAEQVAAWMADSQNWEKDRKLAEWERYKKMCDWPISGLNQCPEKLEAVK